MNEYIMESEMILNANDILVSVQDYDVLLGRGKLYENHLGNLNFQALVKANVDRYFIVLSSEEKYAISKEVVDEIHQSLGGRFLKRGNRCWVPINSLDARKKVAQAFQYQRRKGTKLENLMYTGTGSVDGQSDFAAPPPPPALQRQDKLFPHSDIFGGTSEQQQHFIRHCTTTLMQTKEHQNLDIIASSLYHTSIVEATANAIIAKCGKPTYPLKSNYTNHSISKSSSGKNLSHGGSNKKKQQQQTEKLQQTMMGCSTPLALSDTSGIYSLSDMELNFIDSFEQDESTSNIIHMLTLDCPSSK